MAEARTAMAKPAKASAAVDPNSFEAFPIVEPGEGAGKDEFEAFPILEPSTGQKVGAAAGTATREALQTGGAVSGMLMGASIGALGGPAAPVTVPLGAAVGFGAGYLGGGGVADIAQRWGLAAPEPERQPEGLRPYAYAGQVVGGSLPFAGLPLSAAVSGYRLPASKVGNFLNRIIDFAAEYPKTFFMGEVGAAASAGVAAGVAEAYDPGNMPLRIGAEVAGGMFSPQRLILATGNLGVQSVRRAVQSLSPAGRETAAARVLQDIVANSGDDPEVLARLLQDANLPGMNLTAGQATGSPALIALETRLAKESGKFGAEMEKRAEQGLKDIENMITALRSTGDPAALAEAADLRLRYFRTLIGGRVQAAERDAIEAAGRITGDSPRDRAMLSRQAHNALANAMEDARGVERELWEQVGRDAPARTDALLRRYEEIRAGLLPEESLPGIVEGFVARMRGDAALPGDVAALVERTFGRGAAGPQGQTSAGELIRLRSRLLSLAREAGGQGKSNDARIYGEMAEAALDDLDAAFATGGGEAYTAARAFSRELHDTFTRTFAGDSLAADRAGGARIPPELVMRRAMAGGKEAAELRLQEIEEATGFVARNLPDSPEAAANVAQMLDAQGRVLRLAAADAIDPNTGRISATRLGRFMRDNEALLDRFPEARRDLQAALGGEQRLQDIQAAAEGANRLIDRRAAFARIARVENPADTIAAAIRGANPEGDLQAIARLARRGGTRAIDGLRTVVLDYALDKARNTEGVISLPKLQAALFEPMQAGSRSIVDVMAAAGVMNAADIRTLRTAFERAARIGQAGAGNKAVDEIIGDPDAFTTLITRMIGARAGAAAAEGGAPTLVAASAGSKFARDLIGKIPAGKVTQVLQEAALNPKFMAALLEKPKTQAEGLKLARSIHAYLWQAGVELAGPEEAPAPE